MPATGGLTACSALSQVYHQGLGHFDLRRVQAPSDAPIPRHALGRAV